MRGQSHEWERETHTASLETHTQSRARHTLTLSDNWRMVTLMCANNLPGMVIRIVDVLLNTLGERAFGRRRNNSTARCVTRTCDDMEPLFLGHEEKSKCDYKSSQYSDTNERVQKVNIESVLWMCVGETERERERDRGTHMMHMRQWYEKYERNRRERDEQATLTDSACYLRCFRMKWKWISWARGIYLCSECIIVINVNTSRRSSRGKRKERQSHVDY